jgi:EAL and modified HD-GYP domain-containing signal transduction protein
MENIIKLTSPKDREKQEKAYLTGVLSHLDVLLRMPMSAILDDFKLDPNISEAILKNEGELGQVLSLVKMQETDEGDKISEMLEQLNLVEDSYKQALLDSYGKAI